MKSYPVSKSPIFRRAAILILSAATTALSVSCDSQRGQSQEAQLEQTATKLEAEAGKVRVEVTESASAKEHQAKDLRETKGNEDAAKILEKDAGVTLEVGKMRAEQLEKKAQDLRKQNE